MMAACGCMQASRPTHQAERLCAAQGAGVARALRLFPFDGSLVSFVWMHVYRAKLYRKTWYCMHLCGKARFAIARHEGQHFRLGVFLSENVAFVVKRLLAAF